MKKLSLQLRLIIFFLIIAGGVWISSAILAWSESKEQIDEFFDTYQLVLARQLSTVDWQNITPATQKSVNKIIDNLHDDGEEEDEALGMAVFNNQGHMIFHDNENGKQFRYTNKASGFSQQNIGRKKKPWRIVWLKSIDNKHTIAIGQELDYRNETALELIEETTLPWGCGLIILLAASIWLIYREFRPLKKVVNSINSRTSDNLSPIEFSDAPQEIKPLISAINQLFSRISSMLQMERSFIADAAHELRSPLTALNVQLDVIELAKDDPTTQQKALQNLREGLERSGHLVEQMLALSKLDNLSSNQTEEKLDWQEIIKASIAEHNDAASTKNIKITTNLKNKFSLQYGQKFLWSLLFRNLIDNAIKYSNNGAHIKIETKPNYIKISNNKTIIDKNTISRLGERFFRPAGNNNNGSGLGLSIVEKISAIHQCHHSYSYQKGIFCVTISKK